MNLTNQGNEGAVVERDEARRVVAAAAVALLASGIAACGGGGSATPAPPGGSGSTLPSAAEASRFLAQASIGANREQIARVQAIGFPPGSTSSSRCRLRPAAGTRSSPPATPTSRTETTRPASTPPRGASSCHRRTRCASA